MMAAEYACRCSSRGGFINHHLCGRGDLKMRDRAHQTRERLRRAIADRQCNMRGVEAVEPGVMADPALPIPHLHPKVRREYVAIAEESRCVGETGDDARRNAACARRGSEQDREFGAVATA